VLSIFRKYNEGSGWQYPKDLISDLQLNTWYVLQIDVDDTRGFYVKVYQENNPSVQNSYQREMPVGQTWRFHHWVHNGKAYLDDYLETRLTKGDLTGVRRWDGTNMVDITYQYDDYGNITHQTQYIRELATPTIMPPSAREQPLPNMTVKVFCR